MKRWIYILSGICYGVFEAGSPVRFQWLDHKTGELGEWQELDEDREKEILLWSPLNPRLCLGALEGLAAACQGKDHFTAPDGTEYSKKAENHYVQRHTINPTDFVVSDGEVSAFICPGRETTTMLVRENFDGVDILNRWRDYAPNPAICPVKLLGSFFVEARDGIRLATDVYLPLGCNDRLPTILIRTCYGKTQNKHMYYRFVQRGYAVVIQDTRGREDSEGEFIPQHNEVEDGDDTLSWIAAQSWSDGKVGMIGGSYLGYVQWAAAASGNPHLAAMVSIVTAGSAFVDIPRRGGCFTSGMLAWAFAMSGQTMQPQLMVRDDWDALLDSRPLEQIPVKGLGHSIPFIDKWLEHEYDNAFWQKGNWFTRSSGHRVPAMIVSGWFDDNGMGTTEALELTKNAARGQRKVILGPWNHKANSRYDIHGIPMGLNALRYDMDLLYLQWFDHHLKGIVNGIDSGAQVEYFTLGEDAWKTAEAWPVPRTKPVTLYLGGGGRLSEAQAQDGSDSYDYNPSDPATHIVDVSENEMEVPEDYTQEEKRQDVLCYTTAPLEKPVTVTGDALITLYVSSDAVDTDFVVRITQVDPAGRSIKLADGMLGAKYREGFDAPVWMERERVYPLTIRTTKISNRFPAGSAIRFTVTSSAKNFTFPNSNTKAGFNSDTAVVARNTVWFGEEYPSCVVLPVEM